jgi:hypothetical protein
MINYLIILSKISPRSIKIYYIILGGVAHDITASFSRSACAQQDEQQKLIASQIEHNELYYSLITHAVGVLWRALEFGIRYRYAGPSH